MKKLKPKKTSGKKTRDAIYISIRYIKYYLLMIYQSFINDLPILIFCYMFLNMSQSLANLLSIDYQWFTNVIFKLLSLPIVYQSYANHHHPF